MLTPAFLLVASLSLSLSIPPVTAQAPTTTIPLISGDGPRPPTVTASAHAGTWTPVAPASGPGAGLPPPSMAGMGRQAYINSANDFCLFMPPDPTKENLVDAEADAVAYCVHPFNDTRPMPDGFIKTAHFRRTSNYVQVSGTFDWTKMNFNPSDCGGEYDSHGAQNVGNPVGAAVTQGTNFTQFIGGCDIPGDGTFCLRTCTGDQSLPYCNNRFDLMGCLWVQPGDYDTPGFTNCDADQGLPVGVYNSSYTFTQGMTPTPLPVAPPASSNCQTVSSPTPSGVTYPWAQLAVTSPASSGSASGPKASSHDKNAAASSEMPRASSNVAVALLVVLIGITIGGGMAVGGA